MRILKRIRENREQRQENLQAILHEETDIRKQRIKSREGIIKELLKREREDPCLRQHFNLESLNEFVSDENKSYSVKKMMAIWICLGYIITNFFILITAAFTMALLFRIYLIFSFVSVLVILSYFYTSFKLGEVLRGLFRG
jgi:hypothetical protein